MENSTDYKIVNIYANSINSIDSSTIRSLASDIENLEGDELDQIYSNESYQGVLTKIVEPRYDYDDQEVDEWFNGLASDGSFPAEFIKRIVNEWEDGKDLIKIIDFVDKNGY